MHQNISPIDSWWATQLEGSYIPLTSMRTFDPQQIFHLHIDRGKDQRLRRMHNEDAPLCRAWWGGWVFLRAVLWDSAVRLAGPDIRTLLEPVSQEELWEANLATLEGWGTSILQDLGILRDSGYQSYYVLTLCRILYSHEFGRIVPKQEAANWAKETLGEPWQTLIENAWVGRHHPDVKAEPDNIQRTAAFCRTILQATGLKET